MRVPDRIGTGGPAMARLMRPVLARLGHVADVVVLILLGVFLYSFVQRNVTHQGDLKTYQLAARAVQAGLDPYPPENLAQLAVALVAVFGWNGSAQWDLSAGNVAIVECALVWAAFGCFIAGRRGLFATLIVVAACFKLLPAVFLLLLLLPTGGSKASPRLLGAAFVALLLATLLPAFIGPASGYQKFWIAVPDATAYADANPSALGLLSHLVHVAGLKEGVAEPVSIALWGGFALGLIFASLGVLRASYARKDALHWVMCAMFLYVLLLPRPMAYGFVILTPAPLYLAPRPFDRTAGRLLLALMLAAQGLWRFTLNRSDSFLVTYAPFLFTLRIWLLVVNEHSVSRANANAADAESDILVQAKAS